jgi:hypothetical protein
LQHDAGNRKYRDLKSAIDREVGQP